MGLFLLLFNVWFHSPLRGFAGIAGLICAIWAMLQLAGTHPQRREGRRRSRFVYAGDFFRDLLEAGPRNWMRAAVALFGWALFLWSASPIATMR